MEVKSIDVLSLGKVLGLLYLVIGLIVGFIFSVFAILGTALDFESSGSFGVIFGVGSIIIFPILYGIIGFVSGVVTAAVYNLIARVAGGIKLTLESTDPPAPGM